MFEKTPRETAEKKLIILYVLNKLDTQVTNNQFTKIILESSIMNYFIFQKYLSELVDNKLISQYNDNNTILYAVNDNGRKMLDYFSNMIPCGIKNIIDSNFAKIKKQLKAETSIYADFTPNNETEYTVSCKISEGSCDLLDLKITVGTRKDAHAICNSWKNSAQEIYLYLIGNLIKSQED